MAGSVVQGNRPLRFFSLLILILLVVAHLLGTINLIDPSILWVLVVMSLNALQASFTGFCPMFKDKQGNCVACGVQCSDNESCKPEGCCPSNEVGSTCCQSEMKK